MGFSAKPGGAFYETFVTYNTSTAKSMYVFFIIKLTLVSTQYMGIDTSEIWLYNLKKVHVCIYHAMGRIIQKCLIFMT